MSTLIFDPLIGARLWPTCGWTTIERGGGLWGVGISPHPPNHCDVPL